MRITVFFVVVPCGFAYKCRRFASIRYFHLQGKQKELRGRKWKVFSGTDCIILYHSYRTISNHVLD
jgi:hypothetical protein